MLQCSVHVECISHKHDHHLYKAAKKSSNLGSILRLSVSVAVLSILFVFASFTGLAQNPPVDIPDPSKLEDQFKERSLPQSKLIIQTPEKREGGLGPDENIRFMLHSIQIAGGTVFSEAELKKFYISDLEHEISVGRIFDIAAELTAHYRNQGYILSRVVVPAQEVKNGEITLVAVEGYIENVSVEGDNIPTKRLLARLAGKIKGSKPLKASELERYLLLANDVPGVTATAVLKASETPGATDLAVVVTYDKSDVFASANNRGSRFNGPLQIQAGVQVNSVAGGPSRTGLRLVSSSQTREFKLLELSHQHFVSSEGTFLSFVGRRTFSRPGASLRELDIESNSASARFAVQHPLIRSRAKSLYVRAGLSVRNTSTEILDTAFSEDRVRVAHIGATYDFVDSLDGINLLDIEVSQGLDVFNATRTRSSTQSRADAETKFLKVNGSVMRLQRLASGVSLLADVAGQFTNDGLVASEEFALGGTQYGRAFDPSEITGDRGIAGRMELRYDDVLPGTPIERYQAYIFADYGRVWNRIDGRYQSVDIGSAGGGLRITLNKNVSAYFELAAPIEKTPDFADRFGNSVRGFFGINFRF